MPSRTPTRFPAGFTNVDKFKQFGSIQTPDPLRQHVYLNDFDTFAIADWNLTETNAAATELLQNGDGGQLIVTNTGVSADLASIQKAGESFLFEDKLAIWGKMRFQLSDTNAQDFAIGLCVTDTTPIASVPSDAIYFLKATGQTGIVFRVGKASSYTVSASLIAAGLVNATNYTVGWACSGIQTVVNGVLSYNFRLFAGTDHNPPFITTLSVPVTNTPTTQTITPTISIQTGAAAVKTATIDYVAFGKARF